MGEPPTVDRWSIQGRSPAPTQFAQTVVVGAGSAGIAAALAAAAAGEAVLLIDENPVAGPLMGLDVPLSYGQRMTGAVQAKDRMLEQIFAASPDLETCYEAGIELLLGVYVWGAYVNGAGLQSLTHPVLGLADEERSWLCAFERLVLATGARDLALSFAGWEQPGVMGANGFHALVTRYDAFAGRRIVILGSDDLALLTARVALERGIEVAALIEARDVVQGSDDLATSLVAAGVPILTGCVPLEAQGGIDGVERLRLVGVEGVARATIACDTIVSAIGLVPAVELVDVLGVALEARPTRGGYVPRLDEAGVTTIARVSVVGDATGLADRGFDQGAYVRDWVRALLATGGSAVNVCQCEEVSRAALLGVQAPAYLGGATPRLAARDLHRLLEDGPPDPDQIKRLTRAGMGVCQGRRCREEVACLLALSANIAPEAATLSGYRAPVRPLPLSVLAAWDEAPEMQAGWDVWFGIPSQWTPYQDIGTEREAMHDAILGGNMHL